MSSVLQVREGDLREVRQRTRWLARAGTARDGCGPEGWPINAGGKTKGASEGDLKKNACLGLPALTKTPGLTVAGGRRGMMGELPSQHSRYAVNQE